MAHANKTSLASVRFLSGGPRCSRSQQLIVVRKNALGDDVPIILCGFAFSTSTHLRTPRRITQEINHSTRYGLLIARRDEQTLYTIFQNGAIAGDVARDHWQTCGHRFEQDNAETFKAGRRGADNRRGAMIAWQFGGRNIADEMNAMQFVCTRVTEERCFLLIAECAHHKQARLGDRFFDVGK